MRFKVFVHNFTGHLKTINSHKLMVMKHCFQVGLYKQGLLHDLSKYSPSEFIPGVKYYQGNRSPNNAQREAEGCSTAWLHHKGRNKHHYEYWIDYTSDKDAVISGMKMPVNYVIEMFCDRVAASKIYNKENYTDADSLAYFMKGKGKYIMHPQTEKILLKLLVMLKEKGEAYTFRYIRTRILSDNSNSIKKHSKNP
ncbi:MAG: catalase [Lachnospiraceae bacterium]|nr:catalase [Lachnospiraceae bacterium]MDE7307302.1 catalase [Lachnospiraceae bacterium]